MAGINNTLSNGLVSTNPFLGGTTATGGTTTSAFSPTQASNSAASGYSGVPTTTGFGSSTTGGILPTTSATQKPTTGLIPLGASSAGSVAAKPNTSAATVDYTLHPGESIDAYNARVNTNGNIAATQPQGASQGLGMGGGQAPAGQMYNGQGQLVPISSMENPYTNSGAPSFGQSVGALASTAAQPTQGFTQAQGTAQTAAQNLLNTTPQQNAAVLAQQQSIQKLQGQYADLRSDINLTPGDLSLANGEQGALYNRYSGQLGAQETGLQNILAANAQQQAAYTGAGNLANTSAGVATGQQGTQQQGLGAAASLSQPSYLAPGQSPYSPTTGQYGTIAGTQAGSGGLQNIGNISGQIGVGQNVAQLNSYLGGAQTVGNNLNDLITQNNINPSSLTYLNGALQFGANAMSNPAYQKFAGQINDFVASLAPILGVGGSSTDMKTQMSAQIVNALQSGSSIKDVVSYFLDQAKQKIGGLSAGGGAGVGSGNSGGNTFGNFF